MVPTFKLILILDIKDENPTHQTIEGPSGIKWDDTKAPELIRRKNFQKPLFEQFSNYISRSIALISSTKSEHGYFQFWIEKHENFSTALLVNNESITAKNPVLLKSNDIITVFENVNNPKIKLFKISFEFICSIPESVKPPLPIQLEEENDMKVESSISLKEYVESQKDSVMRSLKNKSNAIVIDD
jgi:hypothetical protein